MSIITFLIYLLVGAGAGWLSSQIRVGRGPGPVASVLLGVVGSFGGGIVLNGMGMVPVNALGSFIAAAFGAAFLLWFVSLFSR